MVLAMYGIAAVIALCDVGLADNVIVFTNYGDKYDYILAGMDDNQIAYVEMFGMIDKVQDRWWQTIEDVKVLRFKSEITIDDLELGQVDNADKYSTVSSAEDLTLSGYDEGIDYFHLAKLMCSGHWYTQFTNCS